MSLIALNPLPDLKYETEEIWKNGKSAKKTTQLFLNGSLFESLRPLAVNSEDECFGQFVTELAIFVGIFKAGKFVEGRITYVPFEMDVLFEGEILYSKFLEGIFSFGGFSFLLSWKRDAVDQGVFRNDDNPGAIGKIERGIEYSLNDNCYFSTNEDGTEIYFTNKELKTILTIQGPLKFTYTKSISLPEETIEKLEIDLQNGESRKTSGKTFVFRNRLGVNIEKDNQNLMISFPLMGTKLIPKDEEIILQIHHMGDLNMEGFAYQADSNLSTEIESAEDLINFWKLHGLLFFDQLLKKIKGFRMQYYFTSRSLIGYLEDLEELLIKRYPKFYYTEQKKKFLTVEENPNSKIIKINPIVLSSSEKRYLNSKMMLEYPERDNLIFQELNLYDDDDEKVDIFAEVVNLEEPLLVIERPEITIPSSSIKTEPKYFEVANVGEDHMNLIEEPIGLEKREYSDFIKSHSVAKPQEEEVMISSSEDEDERIGDVKENQNPNSSFPPIQTTLSQRIESEEIDFVESILSNGTRKFAFQSQKVSENLGFEILPSGDVYVANYQSGLKTGPGKMFVKSLKKVFYGNFFNDLFFKIGIKKFQNCEIYCGEGPQGLEGPAEIMFPQLALFCSMSQGSPLSGAASIRKVIDFSSLIEGQLFVKKEEAIFWGAESFVLNFKLCTAKPM